MLLFQEKLRAQRKIELQMFKAVPLFVLAPFVTELLHRRVEQHYRNQQNV